MENKKKIVFFVLPNLDSFINEIINRLSQEYDTKRVIVTKFNQIDEEMKWADICWFEWCDQLIIYGSKLEIARDKKIICRLHSYEAFTKNITQVKWQNVDKLIFVSDHIRNIVLSKVNINKEQTIVIPNGVDLDKYIYKKREKGFNIAYVGYINFKKGPMLLLHTFKKIYDKDNRYKLYIAGKFQEERYLLYFHQMIIEMGLQNNVIFSGWQNNINKWLEDKNYIICTSILEGHPVGIMEAMARGIKPIVHNFVGARGIYPKKYVWNTIDDAVNMVISDDYDSYEYREFIVENYSLSMQLKELVNLINNVYDKTNILKVISRKIHEKSNMDHSKSIENLTLLITNYNRGEILRNDLSNGFKFLNQRKLIVDDCSTKGKEIINYLEKNKKDFNIERIVRHKENKGLAGARYSGFSNVSTEYTMILDDDDMIFCMDKEKVSEEIKRLSEDAVMVIPRYIISLYDDGRLQIGYDRMNFNELLAKDVLLNLAYTGEVKAFLAGSISKNKNLFKYNPNDKFIVSEDYMTLNRMLANNLNKKVLVMQELVHVRRISKNNLSKTINSKKLALHLVSHLISCYYCYSNNIIEFNQMINFIKKRANLIQEIYGFGKKFSEIVINFINGKISEKEFAKYFKNLDIYCNESLDELAFELNRIKEINDKKNNQYIIRVKDKTLPKVSVLIPAYNKKKFLKEAIESVLKQDYENLEIIISDDCSTDGTDQMMKEYKKYKKIKYYRNIKNLNAVKNSYRLLHELATGEYVLILSDDDYLVDDNYISKAVKFLLENKNISFVWANCKLLYVDENKFVNTNHNRRKITKGIDYFINYEKGEYNHITSGLTSVFNRKKAIEMNCMAEETFSGDLFLWLKLMLTGDVGFINDHVAVYRIHKNNLSNNLILEYDYSTIKELEKLKNTGLEKGIDPLIMEEWIKFRIFKYVRWSFICHYSNGDVQSAFELLNSISQKYSLVKQWIMQSLNIK
ncbi:glycosyltransferase [Haloimpatiens sp. FM7330]|uniref:glycosyltransferase n=1 Tax=Haloimpatiens sp. FM7330 TaxID=3298610 RepID=UPI003642C44E